MHNLCHNQVTGTGINQVITTYDPRLTSLGLPQYPPLPASTDSSKIEEIRRTIYVSDLDPAVVNTFAFSFERMWRESCFSKLHGNHMALSFMVSDLLC